MKNTTFKAPYWPTCIEFGNPENPVAIGVGYAEATRDNKPVCAISVTPIINGAYIKSGEIVPEENLGDMEAIIVFRTETSVDTFIKSLMEIKEMMHNEKMEEHNEENY